jgi:hypothetical protein
MHGGELVAFSVVVSIAIVIVASLYLRYRQREFQHQERMAAIDKGTLLPDIDEPQSPRSGRIYLLRGMMWLFSGIAIVAFLAAMVAYSREPSSMERRLDRTQELRRLGATEEQIQEAEKELPRDAMPGGIPLLGLVPMGIGLAYLIYYRVEGKRAGATG